MLELTKLLKMCNSLTFVYVKMIFWTINIIYKNLKRQYFLPEFFLELIENYKSYKIW